MVKSLQKKLGDQASRDQYINGLRGTLLNITGNGINKFLDLSDEEKRAFYISIFDSPASSQIDLENMCRVFDFGRTDNALPRDQSEPTLRKAARYASCGFSWLFGAVSGAIAYKSSKEVLSDHGVPDGWAIGLSAAASVGFGLVKQRLGQKVFTYDLTDVYDWFSGYRDQEFDFNRDPYPNGKGSKVMSYLGGATLGSTAALMAYQSLPSELQVAGAVVAGVGDSLFWSSRISKLKPVAMSGIKGLIHRTECLRRRIKAPEDDMAYMTYSVLEYMVDLGRSIKEMPGDLVRSHYQVLFNDANRELLRNQLANQPALNP